MPNGFRVTFPGMRRLSVKDSVDHSNCFFGNSVKKEMQEPEPEMLSERASVVEVNALH
jgi:hypothetical protein